MSTPPHWRSTGLTAIRARGHAASLSAAKKFSFKVAPAAWRASRSSSPSTSAPTSITTTSTANIDYVGGLGADEVIDYSTTDFTRAVANCDAVFDTVGGDVAIKSFAVLKPGGRAAFIASGWKAPQPTRDDVTSLRPNVVRARAPLERIGQLVAAGAVRPPEVKLFRLSQAQKRIA